MNASERSTFGFELSVADRTPWQRTCKRGIDLAGAVSLLLLSAPILAMAIILVRLSHGAPVFFASTRLGLNGEPFSAWKLRTMRLDAEGWLQDHPELSAQFHRDAKLNDDPRVTRIGRWLRRTSIDELPQLINVLKGEMSLVGPRVMLPHEIEHWGSYSSTRLSVPQGLTGLWQICARGNPYEARMSLDREYIENWSLGLDLWILIRTVPAVLSGRGAV
ncbi:MAG TPA: sugar transferase [Candidatus Acidoferrum sp.]|nr:sugar transferase [Candidatus Acidoferrum sp.]